MIGLNPRRLRGKKARQVRGGGIQQNSTAPRHQNVSLRIGMDFQHNISDDDVMEDVDIFAATKWVPHVDEDSEYTPHVQIIRRHREDAAPETTQLTAHRSDRFTTFVDPESAQLFSNKRLMSVVARFLSVETWYISLLPLNKTCNSLVEMLCRSRHQLFQQHFLHWDTMNARIRVTGAPWFSGAHDGTTITLSAKGLSFRWKHITYIERHVLPHHFEKYFQERVQEDQAQEEMWMQFSVELFKLREGKVRWNVTREAWEHQHVVYSGEIFGVFVDAFVARKDGFIRVELDGTSNDLSFVG